MKKIVIVMDRMATVTRGRVLTLEAKYDDGGVLRLGMDTAFLGQLEISRQANGDLMTSEQMWGFLNSVVLPQLELFARQIENEVIEEEEVALEAEVGPAP